VAGDPDAAPTRAQQAVQGLRGRASILRGEVVTAQVVDADVLEDQGPEGHHRFGLTAGIRCDAAACAQHRPVQCQVAGKVDLHHVVHAGRSRLAQIRRHLVHRSAGAADHSLSTGLLGDGDVLRPEHRGEHPRAGLSGEADGQRTDRASAAVHQQCPPGHRAGHVHGAVGRQAGNAQAGTQRQRHAFREHDSLGSRQHHPLRGCALRPVALGAVAPHRLAEARSGHAPADPVDDAAAIAVRDDTGEGHPVAKGIGPLFHVARVDTGVGQADAHLPRAGHGHRHAAHLQNLLGGPLGVVPGRPHWRLLNRWVARRALSRAGGRRWGEGHGTGVCGTEPHSLSKRRSGIDHLVVV
jgi:hypothetical protein